MIAKSQDNSKCEKFHPILTFDHCTFNILVLNQIETNKQKTTHFFPYSKFVQLILVLYNFKTSAFILGPIWEDAKISKNKNNLLPLHKNKR